MRVAPTESFKSVGHNAFFIGLVVLTIHLSAFAQDRNSHLIQPGLTPEDYSPNGISSLNYYNGNLVTALPVARLGGRGDAGFTLNLVLQSQWTVQNMTENCNGAPEGCADQGKVYSYLSSTGTPQLITPNDISAELRAVMQDGLSWYKDGPGRVLFDGDECSSYFQGRGTLGITFITQEGSTYRLRDAQTNGHPLTVYEAYSNYNMGRIFVSGEGNALTFVSDVDVVRPNSGNCDPDYPSPSFNRFNISGYLLFPDGTRYRVENSFIKWMRDRNGNQVTFFYDQIPTPYNPVAHLIKVTDSLNREINISYRVSEPDPYGLSDVITMKGFGGAIRTFHISYQPVSNILRSDFSQDSFLQAFNDLDPNILQPNTEWRTRPNPFYAGVAPATIRVSALWLPDGRRFNFKYNNYGEVARVEFPLGGAYEYDWAGYLGTGSGVYKSSIWFGAMVYRRLKERRSYGDGSTVTGRTNYSVNDYNPNDPDPTLVTVEAFDANSTRVNREKHYYYGNAQTTKSSEVLNIPTYYYTPWRDGREYRSESFAADGTTLLRRENTVWQQTDPTWVQCSGGDCIVPENNPHIAEVDTVLGDTNQVSARTFSYDQFNNLTDEYDYDFGNGAAGALLRHAHVDYVTSSDYVDAASGAYLCRLPARNSVYDGSGTEGARVNFEYDTYITDANHAPLLDRPGISGLDSGFTTSYLTRGNATATTRSLLVSGSVVGSVTSYAQFDVAGNTIKTIDARGYATNFDYSDRFGAPDGEARGNSGPIELGGLNSFAFPTLVTNALGHTTYTQFDYYLGRAVDAEDANGAIGSTYFNDSLDRLTQVRRATGTSSQSQTTINYDDANRSVLTSSDLTTYNDNALKNQTIHDGLGRLIETRQYEGGSNYIATQTLYDALGRTYKVSNPFRPWNSESAIWTTTVFDALSRIISVTTPDSAVINTSYSGNATTVIDQGGKVRKSLTDALGRLTAVFEDPNGLNYQTSYGYDVLDDLTSVSQGSQTRSFTYDSLKRLIAANNPESGTISYQYDNNGNLAQKTDARNVITTFGSYDALNRPTTKSYSDGTPAVTFSYDTATSGKGRLTSISSSVSTYNYSAYNPLGLPVGASQILGGQTYSLGYTYDLAGHVKTMQYPSGHNVNYDYDSAGRTSTFAGSLGDGTNRTYSSGMLYSDFGSLGLELYGTAAPVYNKLLYNSRGQLAEIREGRTYASTGDTGWELGAIINHYSNTCWGMCGGSNSTTSMTDNNGNVRRQEHWIQDGNGNVTAIFTQQYDYDSLNRLARVYDGTNWQQQYSYDRYGNRTIDQTNTWGAGIPNPNFGVDTISNRLNAPAGYLMSYDAAGNLTTDTYTGEGTRIFDAENRMTQAWANSLWQTYTYDAAGRRVKRNVNGNEVWQVYGIGGEIVAEYAANGVPANPQKEYGYRGSQLLITAEPSANTHWIVSDQLGTPRIVIDQSGSLSTVSRHDYLPFGEELFAGVGGRTPGLGYTGDSTRQKFTQKERDNETGLDYFIARYYASAQGRFTSADNVAYSKAVDPQTWNQYAYCRNGPLNRADIDGHNWFLVHHKWGDAWEWHEGDRYKVPDTGKKLRSPYTNLIVITIDYKSGANRWGAYNATVTVYGKDFNDVKAQDTYSFSGGYGRGNEPPAAGEYFINLAKVGKGDSGWTTRDGALANFHDGFQYVPETTRDGAHFQGSWGHMRANLSKAAWVDGEPVFRAGNGTLRYLHGHENSYFRNTWFPYDSTLGCVATPEEKVLNWLSHAIGNKQVNPQIPTSVKAGR